MVDAFSLLAGEAGEAGRVPHGSLLLVLLWLLGRGLTPLKDTGDRMGMGSELDSMGSGECGGELGGAGGTSRRRESVLESG